MTGQPFMRNFNRPGAWSRPLSDFVDPCVAPALARYGFGQADLITCWADIVGERVASYSEPIRLQWGRRSAGGGSDRGAASGSEAQPASGPLSASGPQPATLILRVEGGGALELQHMGATVIERINRHLGWRCVGKLAFRQAPLVGRAEPKRRPPAPGAAAVLSARSVAADIEDPRLRDALVRLGARVLDRSR